MNADSTASAAPQPRPAEQQQANADAPLTQYTMFSVFRRDPANELELARHDITRAIEELDAVVAGFDPESITLRGFYDVSGFRHDGELMVWLHGPEPQDLQWALRQIRRTQLFRYLIPSWQCVGVHRAAEFNPRHMPAYMLGKEPQQWVTVYPFVRSYDWYLLPEDERREMLADHGRRGAAFRTTLANTVAAFGISDYEWLLALEDNDLMNLVDMMRDLRQTEARLHVREETPFYPGRRIETAEIPEVLQ
ncbi:chlorite dismutase family protein [Pseudoclavibacter alba]|uniref:Coproheme decarboxylase n=1 Tax=Pseudoclavibacter albus TaxID=272241 RepID=A0ABT2HYL3_9MICO|nr:hydrogen peroxide-dependent heme synthase [Pseudoclavibacter alba]MBN6778651.1 chlorite dismutase family protein [Pseudoclavibacter alba]MCT2043246.1 chlorite dismutase family protein [Pseudoclavibacter alba]